MNRSDGQILEQWLEDLSFIRWCTEPDSADFLYWESWLDQNPHRRELAELGALIIRGIKIREKEISSQVSQASLNKVMARIPFDALPTVPLSKSNRNNPTFLKIAAAILVLICASFWVYLDNRSLKVVLSTNYGEKLELVLPDQTQVILNANSTLEYDRRNSRDVFVEGEVFFHVKKKPENGEKFHVRTRNLSVEVLGTSFNVNTRDIETEVYLQEGKIKLDLAMDAGSAPILMEPGDLYKYTAKRTPVLVKRQIKTEEKTDWTDGTIEFENSLVNEVFSRLSQIYGFELGPVSEDWDRKRISVGIPINDEKLTLEILSVTLGVDVRREDNTWIFELGE